MPSIYRGDLKIVPVDPDWVQQVQTVPTGWITISLPLTIAPSGHGWTTKITFQPLWHTEPLLTPTGGGGWNRRKIAHVVRYTTRVTIRGDKLQSKPRRVLTDAPITQDYLDVYAGYDSYKHHCRWKYATGFDRWNERFYINSSRQVEENKFDPSVLYTFLDGLMDGAPVEPLLDWLIDGTEFAEFITEPGWLPESETELQRMSMKARATEQGDLGPWWDGDETPTEPDRWR